MRFDGIERVREHITRLPVMAREADVLRRAGLAPITCPDEIASGLVTMRQFGSWRRRASTRTASRIR